MPDPVYRAIRKAEADYEFLGELGRDAYGNPAFLARSRSTGELVAIRVETTPGPQGESEVSLVVAHQLDSSVPSPRSSCPSCGAAIEGWSRYCGVCGEDVSGYAYGQTAGRRREDLLAAVRRAAEGKFEILGEMDRAEGGGIVYFARELGSGRLVTLRLQRDTSQSEVPAYMIGVTQVMRVLPWMAGVEVRAAPARRKRNRRRSASARRAGRRMRTEPGSVRGTGRRSGRRRRGTT